jgi:uncharacterized membrane protein
MPWFRRRKPAVSPAVRKNISSIAELEKELANQRAPLDRVSDNITSFTGSIRFIIAHVLFFAAWFLINSGVFLRTPYDPFPYVFLNLVLAVEAVLLGTFVLMSQNRQNRQADLWLHVVLQVSLLAEQESTKTLQLLQRICEHLDIRDAAKDAELKQLIQKTQLETLTEELKEVREQAAESPAEGAAAPARTGEPIH